MTVLITTGFNKLASYTVPGGTVLALNKIQLNSGSSFSIPWDLVTQDKWSVTVNGSVVQGSDNLIMDPVNDTLETFILVDSGQEVALNLFIDEVADWDGFDFVARFVGTLLLTKSVPLQWQASNLE